MIPNSAPMAAVYLTAAKKPMSRPVAAWSTNGVPLVYVTGLGLNVVEDPVIEEDFIGMWQNGWSPSQDEMASLLPEHVPGTPHPLAVGVTLWQNADTPLRPGGWDARLTDDDKFVTDAPTLTRLEEKLSALGGFTVDRTVWLDER